MTTCYAGGKYQTKEPRTFVLPHPITVGEVSEPTQPGGGEEEGEEGTYG